jgi:HK97 family phage major capsid protein
MALVPIHALRQRLAGVQSKLQTIHNRSEAEGRQLTTQEQGTWDELIAEKRTVSARLAEVEAAMETERNSSGAVQIPHSGVPWQQAGQAPEIAKVGKGFKARSAKYRDVFPDAPISNGGFNSFNEFMSAWHNAPKQFDPRLRMSQGENTPALGGFLVPDEYAAMIMDAALENEIVRPRAQVWSMSSERRKVPAWDGFDHTSNLYGGFTAQWVSEGAAITATDAKTRLITLTANKLALLGNASNELVADVPGGFGTVYGAAMSAAASWFLDYYFLNGDGAGQPLGVLRDPALVIQAKDSGDATTAMSFKDIVAMFSRLHPSSIANAIWVASSTTIPALMSLSNANAPLVPLVTQQSDGKLYMLSKEILFTEKLPTLGNQGDILLADFSKYAIGLRQGTTLEQSQQAGFTTDSTYFRVITRLDGQGTWKAPVTPKNGSTLSWCVTLAARP